MFANRFTALLDACALAGALQRNLLLSLAEAELFRPRWTPRIRDETEKAVREILERKNDPLSSDKARKVRTAMQSAFEDAMVHGHEILETSFPKLPDENDRHVVAAALKTRASVIVTDNLRDFPKPILAPLDLEAITPDEFIANSIDLDPRTAMNAIEVMRRRLNNPPISPETLILKLEQSGLLRVADMIATLQTDGFP